VKRDARSRVPRRPSSLLCISSIPCLNRVRVTSVYRSSDWLMRQSISPPPGGIVVTPVCYPVPDTSGDGVLFSIDFFLSFFVSLLARLRENGRTVLRKIFREGVE